MTISTVRTVSHFFEDGSEAMIVVKRVEFPDGTTAIALRNEDGEESIMIHSKSQLDELVRGLEKLGDLILT